MKIKRKTFITVRGRFIFSFQISRIGASYSSLERFWVEDQKLSLVKMSEINGLVFSGRQSFFFKVNVMFCLPLATKPLSSDTCLNDNF